jgi:hypothetical protein
VACRHHPAASAARGEEEMNGGEDMDRDVELAVEQQHTMNVIKAIGRVAIIVTSIIGVAGYACERSSDQASMSKPPCKTYVCTDK